MPTKISYCDETWNPVIGCTKCSPGCLNCYAEKMAVRQWHIWKYDGGSPYDKTISLDSQREQWGWSGNVVCRDDQLTKPLHWRKPRIILVPSMGDLFHPKMPFEFIDKVMQIISTYPQQHTFLILTKRPKIMADYFKQLYVGLSRFHKGKDFQWPFKNIHLGVTISTQKEADEKIPLLLQIPAAHRWISAEPLLSEINFRWTPYAHQATGETYRQYLERNGSTNEYEALRKISRIVIGCESGHHRRPCKLEWIRSIVQQCKVAGVKIFVKQLALNGKIEHNMEKFPKDLQIREFLNA